MLWRKTFKTIQKPAKFSFLNEPVSHKSVESVMTNFSFIIYVVNRQNKPRKDGTSHTEKTSGQISF